jgi:GGDEF domain-containing protein
MLDPLTGLKNRRYLNAFMPEEVARTMRRQREREVAGVMRTACRASDIVVRRGGEEFLIVARNIDRYQAGVLADQCMYAAKKSGRDCWVDFLVQDADANATRPGFGPGIVLSSCGDEGQLIWH